MWNGIWFAANKSQTRLTTASFGVTNPIERKPSRGFCGANIDRRKLIALNEMYIIIIDGYPAGGVPALIQKTTASASTGP